MKEIRRNGRRLMTIMLVILGLTIPATSFIQADDDPHPRVVPPNSRPFGLTYGEWSARWVQWALAIPTPDNPILDTTGADCAVGQRGPVWFLAGTFGTTVTRHCTVPEGKAIFFPIVNAFCFPPPADVAQLRADCRDLMNQVANLSASVDGVPIRDLTNVLTTRFRVVSPVFSFRVPADNILEIGGPQTVQPAVDDGVFIMLRPLPDGRHVIRFHGELPAFGFMLDVTYHIRVREHDDDDDND